MSRAYYCPSCGRLASEPCGGCARHLAAVKDLKARLKRLKPVLLNKVKRGQLSADVLRIIDLRNKNWMKT